MFFLIVFESKWIFIYTKPKIFDRHVLNDSRNLFQFSKIPKRSSKLGEADLNELSICKHSWEFYFVLSWIYGTTLNYNFVTK